MPHALTAFRDGRIDVQRKHEREDRANSQTSQEEGDSRG